MARYAKRKRDGSVELKLPGELRTPLRDLMRQLDQLLDTSGDQQQESVDPLAELTGMTGLTGLEERSRPDDPALLRLRPDAYGPDVDDGAAAAEYRRFTESELESIQRARVSIVLDGLAETGRITLTPDDAEAWLGALNDARLVLATRLGIDHDEWQPGPGTADLLLFLYQALSVIFSDLLSAVMD